jgi:hypothetical protein
MQVAGIVYWAVVILLVLNVSIVLLTVGVKAVRTIKVGWYKRHFRRIEPAVEDYIITGKDQPELEALRPWQKDVFVSRLIVERMALVRGPKRRYSPRGSSATSGPSKLVQPCEKRCSAGRSPT